MCPVGSVAKWFVVFWITVAQMSGLSSVNTSIKLIVVRNFEENKVCGIVGKN